MKKITKGGLIAAMALTMISSVTVANYAKNIVKAETANAETATATVTNANVITSGTFDNGKTGEELQANTDAWSVNTVVSGDEAYSGYSLKVTATDAASGSLFNYGAGNVMKDKIKAHTPYKMSYMIKVTGAASGFKVCPYFQPNGGTSAGRLIFGTDDRSSTYKLDVSADTGWVSKTAYFVTGDDVSAPRMGFRYKGTGEIYLDNITIVEDDNYLVDGNMETTETWNGATISEEGGYFGKGIVSKGTSETDSKNYFATVSSLITGERYVATAKVKVTDKGAGTNISLRIFNFADGATQTEVTRSASITQNTDGWETLSVEFVAGAQAATRWHRFQFVCNGINTTYIDEVKVVKKSNAATVPSSEILSEGFEGEKLNATLTGDKGNDVLTYGYGAYGKNAQIEHFATSGTKNYVFAFNNDIPLKKSGESYNSIKIKFAYNASGVAKIGAKLVDGDNVISEIPLIGEYTNGSGWVEANVDFAIPENAPDAAKLYLTCEFAAENSTLQLDNFYAEGTMPASINVTFDGNDSQIVKEGNTVVKPSDPTKVGYKFVGWYKGEDLYDFETVISATDESFNLTSVFELDITDLTKENVTADGLKLADGEQIYKVAKNADGDVQTIYANKSAAEDLAIKFVKEKQITAISFDYLVYGSVSDYAINYIGKDGTTATAQTATINADGGWHTVTLGASDDFSALEIALEGFKGELLIANVNVTLKTYEVKFVDDEGNALSGTLTIINGETVAEKDIPSPEKEGYEFIEWVAAGKTFDKNTVIDKNVTVSARYAKLCTVTVVDAEGTTLKTFTVKEGESFNLSSIADLTPGKNSDDKNTYTFKGWAIGENELQDSYVVSGDVTITPVYTAVEIPEKSGCSGSAGVSAAALAMLVSGVALVFKKRKK